MRNEYVWSIDILGTSTLELDKGDLVNEHDSPILEEPLDPCSPEKPPESIHSAKGTYESYIHPMPSDQTDFKRMVVDAFVYHKYCKSHSGFCHKSCSENDNGPSCTDDEREATSPRFAAT